MYDANYHPIWCPKHGKPILEEAKVKEFLEDQEELMSELSVQMRSQQGSGCLVGPPSLSLT